MLEGVEAAPLLVNHSNSAVSSEEPHSPTGPGLGGLIVRVERALHIRKAVKAFRNLTALQIITIIVLVLLVVGGNGGQVITLNMWTNNFAKHQQPRPFTILTLSAATVATAFGLTMLVRGFVLRPNLRFLLSLKGFVLTIIVGFCNATNGVFLVYATHQTPEVLQALLLSTQIFWTLFFSALILREDRSYVNWAVLISFLFSTGGIVLGASASFTSAAMKFDAKMWTIIFAGSMIPGALYNVFASMYMRSFTRNAEDGDGDSDANEPFSPVTVDNDAVRDKSDGATVKFMMLCTTGFSQVFWMFVYFPLDSAPWFGTTNSFDESWKAMDLGWKCVFDNSMCRDNFMYYLLFNGSYFASYIGSAYLNHYSAGLNSIVTQLSAPLAAIILIIIPAWNVQDESYAVGPAIGGAVLIMIGSLIYASWEQGSREKNEAAAVVLRGAGRGSGHGVQHQHYLGDAEDDPQPRVWL